MKLNFGRLFDDKRFLIVFSVVAALISWLITVIFINTEAPQQVKGVPVDLTSSQTTETLGLASLNIVDSGEIKVDVIIEGDRRVIGGIGPSDLLVTPDLSGITRPGTYKSVRLNCKSRYVKGIQIKEIKPDTITLKVDRFISRKFALTTDIEGLQIPEVDYLGNGTVVSPREVEIYGPENEINKIDKCVVSATFTEPLTSNKTVKSNIVLYDSEGNELPKDQLTMDSETADITVKVLKQKRLPVRFEYLNPPAGFPIEALDYKLTQGDLLVAGPAEAVDALSDLLIGYVDLKEITPGFAQVFDVSLPDGFINVDNVKTIGITFENEDMVQAIYNITNISVTNVPVNYTVTVNTAQITGVTMVGDPEVLENLSSQDIIAEIDLSEREITPGPYSLPVHISVPGRKLAWAVGDYTAVVTIKEKS